MSTKLPYIITPKGVSVMLNGKMRTLAKESKNYEALCEELVKPTHDLERIACLCDIRTHLQMQKYADVCVREDAVLYKGEVIHGVIAEKLSRMLRAGEDLEPLSLFLDKLMQNPSEASRNELYLWLEAGNAPICPDGDFLAFKRVNANYTDCYTGTIDNSVGQVVEMPREDVDDNRRNECSRGLHFCQHEYLRVFRGGRTMILKINPADVVSIPVDYNFQKGRCWRYVVVGETSNDEQESAKTFEGVEVDKTFTSPEQSREEAKKCVADKAAEKQTKRKATLEAPVKTVKVYGVHDGVSYTEGDIRSLIRCHGSKRAAARRIGVTWGRFGNWIKNIRKDGKTI